MELCIDREIDVLVSVSMFVADVFVDLVIVISAVIVDVVVEVI